MRLSREVKTGLLILSGILLFIFGFNYLKGENLLGGSRIFYAEYGNIEGLELSAPVTISGNKVGRVLDIAFKDDGSGKLIVKLIVDSHFEFSKNSRAELYETGLIGGKAIAIILAIDQAPRARDGDFLSSDIKPGLTELVNQRLTPLQEKMERMMVHADSLLGNLNSLFDSQTKSKIKNSIGELEVTITTFKNVSKSLGSLLTHSQKDIQKTLQNTTTLTANLATLSTDLKTANLPETIATLETTLAKVNAIMADLQKGKGSMGKLLKDDALYTNLKGASKEMEALLRDIKLHPKRYFRILSRKEIPYKAEPNKN